MEYLCIWRGCGVSNDGSRKAGYAAPGVAGQVAAITAALEAAEVDSSDVSYVECHATGTLVGDGIELRALTEAFAATTTKRPNGHCAIGSSKGNIGHANAAAGVTGLIKAAMCLQRRTLVPTAHYESLNAKVVLEGGPFHVHTGGGSAWPAPPNGTPRSAGSRPGGANVHAILQEPPQLPGKGDDPCSIQPSKRLAHVLTLSAKSAMSLSRAAASLSKHIASLLVAGSRVSEVVPPLGRMAHTLHLGREEFMHRAFIVANSHASAVEALNNASESAADDAAAGGLGSARKPPQLLFIFPGQGSQCPRMGEGLYKGEPIYRDHIDRLCETLLPMLGFDLRLKLFPNAPNDDETSKAYLNEFNAPLVTQPAIFVTELALGYTLLDMGVMPKGLAGHSIGEFVAATLAGVFSELTRSAHRDERGYQRRRR